MPVYEYECVKCHKVTEVLRKMSAADEPQVCEHCGSDKTKRAYSLVALNSGSTGGPSQSGGHVHSGSCGCGKPRGGCGA